MRPPEITTEDIAFTLADSVVGARYEDIGDEVVENTKNSILDTVGCILGGSTLSPTAGKIVEMVKDGGGVPESTILVFGGKVPCWMAAFANGSLGHSLDYDDLHYESMVHPTMSTLPAALATAECSGKLSGKELITAIAVANDVICRLALSVTRGPEGRKSGWNYRQVLGYFSAAAAAGKMLGLNKEQMVSAFGVASQMAAGTNQPALDTGSNFRGIYPAPAGLGGVLSAIMAQKGIIGPRHSLEGKAGLYKMYFGDIYDRDAITDGLGKGFQGKNVGFKPWASCGYTQAYIDATLQLVKQHDIKPDDIAEIIAVVGDNTQELCEPLEVRQKPPNEEAAKWSIPWTIACAAVRRKVSLRDFTADGIKDPTTLKLARKVAPRFDPAFNEGPGTSGTAPAGRVEIEVGDMVVCRTIYYPYGDPMNPMTKDDLISKFVDCASYSAKPLAKSDMDALIRMISKLEELDDIHQIIQLI